jgi:hypothetical protein
VQQGPAGDISQPIPLESHSLGQTESIGLQ